MSYVEDFNQCYEAVKDNLKESEEVIDSAAPFMNHVGTLETQKMVRSMYREQCGRSFENANEAFMLLKPIVLDRISAKTMEWIFMGREVGKNVNPLILEAAESKQWEKLWNNDNFREGVRLSIQGLSQMDTMMLQNRVNAVLAGQLGEFHEELAIMHIADTHTHKIWDLFQMFYELATVSMFVIGVKMGEKTLVNDEFESLMDNLIKGSGHLADPTEEEE